MIFYSYSLILWCITKLQTWCIPEYVSLKLCKINFSLFSLFSSTSILMLLFFWCIYVVCYEDEVTVILCFFLYFCRESEWDEKKMKIRLKEKSFNEFEGKIFPFFLLASLHNYTHFTTVKERPCFSCQEMSSVIN
jgi:hypothetical protein